MDNARSMLLVDRLPVVLSIMKLCGLEGKVTEKGCGVPLRCRTDQSLAQHDAKISQVENRLLLWHEFE